MHGTGINSLNRKVLNNPVVVRSQTNKLLHIISKKTERLMSGFI